MNAAKESRQSRTELSSWQERTAVFGANTMKPALKRFARVRRRASVAESQVTLPASYGREAPFLAPSFWGCPITPFSFRLLGSATALYHSKEQLGCIEWFLLRAETIENCRFPSLMSDSGAGRVGVVKGTVLKVSRLLPALLIFHNEQEMGH